MTTALSPDVRPPLAKTPARRRLGNARRTPLSRAILFVMAVLLCLFLVPFLLVVINAFKSSSDFAAHGPLSWPGSWHIGTIKSFWSANDFTNKLENSCEISLAVAVFGVLLSLLNSFAIGIGRVRGRTWFLVFFLLANVLPQEGLIYPLYYMAKQVHLYDSKYSLIIILTVTNSAFGTYLLSSVFAAFPRELIEAAAIDGAGSWRILWRIVVPVSRPTLSVLFTFFFIWSWNEFLLPLVFLVSNDHQTVPIALASLQGEHLTDLTGTAAASLLGILPAMIFFLLFQRTLTRGVAAGAVK
jgi:raffinose/stachyose/melibiose transport system permease protein